MFKKRKKKKESTDYCDKQMPVGIKRMEINSWHFLDGQTILNQFCRDSNVNSRCVRPQ